MVNLRATKTYPRDWYYRSGFARVYIVYRPIRLVRQRGKAGINADGVVDFNVRALKHKNDLQAWFCSLLAARRDAIPPKGVARRTRRYVRRPQSVEPN